MAVAQEYSAVPGSFTLERTFDAPIAKVYAAFANKQAKEKWFFKGPVHGWAATAWISQ